MPKKKTRKSTKKLRKEDSVDDRLIRASADMRQFAKKPEEYDFKKFVECDWAYVVNDWASLKTAGSVIILIKDEKILDLFGPVSKILIESELVHGETLRLEYLSKNKFKIRHVYFKLAISYRNGSVLIQPRNIFKDQFLYTE